MPPASTVGGIPARGLRASAKHIPLNRLLLGDHEKFERARHAGGCPNLDDIVFSYRLRPRYSSRCAGLAAQAGRRASDSHIPPPINVSPDARPSNLTRAGFMNQARPNPEAIAQHESLKPASSAETTHITAI